MFQCFSVIVQPYMGSCEVRYHEGNYAGQFQEKVEIDKAYGVYEKLEVPPVLDSRRSTIVHDFEKVGMNIVLLAIKLCFFIDIVCMRIILCQINTVPNTTISDLVENWHKSCINLSSEKL